MYIGDKKKSQLAESRVWNPEEASSSQFKRWIGTMQPSREQFISGEETRGKESVGEEAERDHVCAGMIMKMMRLREDFSFFAVPRLEAAESVPFSSAISTRINSGFD